MRPWLERYPDHRMAALLTEGFANGFLVPSFTGSGCTPVKNLLSVSMHSNLVLEKICKELSEGRVAGPFNDPPFSNFRLSPLGIVPKKELGAFRLIHHLSYPPHSSLNDEVASVEAPVCYASFDEALCLLRQAGQGAVLAKADIKSAFRLLPVHPQGFNSLGFQFLNKYYFDKCMPMGFSMSCFYFEAFSSFLHWVVSVVIPQGLILHYLDDFLFLGPRGSSVCMEALQVFFDVCHDFGVPLAQEKTVFPTTVIEFLGITVDSERMEFRLPQQKIHKMKSMIATFLVSKKVCLKEAQSLLGLFAFAARVIPMARVFSRRFSLAIKGMVNPYAHFRISKSIKDDLRIWDAFLNEFNGSSAWQMDFINSSQLEFFTDAAGSAGFGAFLDGRWCAQSWHPDWLQKEILQNLVLLELFPVIVSVVVWEDIFRNRRILVHTDNKGVFFAINTLSSKSDPVLRLLRFLVLHCMNCNIWLRAEHIAGKENNIADSLSRSQFKRFRELAPSADQHGTPCPDFLWGLIWE